MCSSPAKRQICYIYCSPHKSEMYLYLHKKDCFEDVPATLLANFGSPQFVMMLDLLSRDSLARVSIEIVRADITQHGFHLQMPPQLDNFLENQE